MLERDGYGVPKAFAPYPLRIRLKLVLQRRGAHARACGGVFGLSGRVSPAAADVLDSLCVCRSSIHPSIQSSVALPAQPHAHGPHCISLEREMVIDEASMFNPRCLTVSSHAMSSYNLVVGNEVTLFFTISYDCHKGRCRWWRIATKLVDDGSPCNGGAPPPPHLPGVEDCTTHRCGDLRAEGWPYTPACCGRQYL
jgi:hypothetical protein